MYPNILTEDQTKLLPFVSSFSDYYLAGGTALALQLGHRKSIDFDLFSEGDIDSTKIDRKVKRARLKLERVLVKSVEEYTFVINGVKCTFLSFPFKIKADDSFGDIKMPDTLTIGAMKAFALGKRSKWKDYVDLSFIFKKYSLVKVVDKAKEVFGSFFNDRLFVEQLCYFEDIDYTEAINYVGEGPSDAGIKKFLEDIAKNTPV